MGGARQHLGHGLEAPVWLVPGPTRPVIGQRSRICRAGLPLLLSDALHADTMASVHRAWCNRSRDLSPISTFGDTARRAAGSVILTLPPCRLVYAASRLITPVIQWTAPPPFINSSILTSIHSTPARSRAARVIGLPVGRTTTPGARGTMLIAVPPCASAASG